ncbi:MAG: 16S rRNA (cytosine(967)-C(5))-methyltransferase RsmB [Lachnospiraceae bacterium]|nr:16S rRNA (cytosine(967)-C(5))-methyltransferase RsmB [Lachnospiraceae bacterium]
MEEEDVTNAGAVNTRAIVLDILTEVLENEQYGHLVINSALKKYQYLSKQDRAFIDRVSQGTIEKKITIDYIINLYSSVLVKKMKPVIRNIIRMSVYQIVFMDGIKDYAVCDEAVKLAKKRGFAQLKGFVNGVLRNISRQKENIEYPNSKANMLQYLSVKYSIPQWIIISWQNEYSDAEIEDMLKAFEEKRPTTIRCNKMLNSLDELKKKLDKEGIKYEPAAYIPYALNIYDYNYLEELECFEEGAFQIQDVSSMLVGLVASPKKGDTVIDVCAAPGGKTVHIADLLEDTGYVEARDILPNKVLLIKENISRNKLNNAMAVVKDALVLDEEAIEKADIVLADLPCSGLGILGRKPDIKYNMTPEKQEDLVKLQRSMLEIVCQYVKIGGHLIYSTCTINQKENIENIRWFADNYGFEFESLDNVLPKELHSKTTAKGYIQLLPGKHNCDGFFIAKLKRIK